MRSQCLPGEVDKAFSADACQEGIIHLKFLGVDLELSRLTIVLVLCLPEPPIRMSGVWRQPSVYKKMNENEPVASCSLLQIFCHYSNSSQNVSQSSDGSFSCLIQEWIQTMYEARIEGKSWLFNRSTLSSRLIKLSILSQTNRTPTKIRRCLIK